ncbi:retrotransposon protein, putative, ty1-copia subclass [Tanacetum coccineum]
MNIIEQPIPPAPAADSAANVLAEWNAVYDAHNEVACLMLGSMTPELHRQFENSSPYEMLQELKSMFKKQAGVESVGLILNDLTSDFAGFVRNDNMHNIGKTIGGRIQKANKKLQNAKGKGKGKGKGKDKSYVSKPKNPKPNAKEHPTKNDACHHCKEGLRGVRKLKQGDLYLYVGNGVRAQVEAIESYDLVLPNGLVICLDNCHYAPSITRSVVSVSCLVENGFVQCFTDYGISVSRNNVLYFNVIPSNGIYEIDMSNFVPNDNSIYNLQHDGLLKSMDDESFDQCVYCLSGKMTMKSFPHRLERATGLLGIIHIDVCEPLRHVSRKDDSYFITFTNDYSRYGYIYLLKHKHEVFETFKMFKNEVENQLGKTIKALRSDRGGEYISQEFKDYLKACAIVQTLYTATQWGV